MLNSIRKFFHLPFCIVLTCAVLPFLRGYSVLLQVVYKLKRRRRGVRKAVNPNVFAKK